MFWKRKFITCPHCGSPVKADHSYCMNCHRGLYSTTRSALTLGRPRLSVTDTLKDKSARQKSGKAPPAGQKSIFPWINPLGWILLFIFPPLGIFLLVISFTLRHFMKKDAIMPCPHCYKKTVAFMGTAQGTEFPCFFCKKKIRIERQDDKPVFIKA